MRGTFLPKKSEGATHVLRGVVTPRWGLPAGLINGVAGGIPDQRLRRSAGLSPVHPLRTCSVHRYARPENPCYHWLVLCPAAGVDTVWTQQGWQLATGGPVTGVSRVAGVSHQAGSGAVLQGRRGSAGAMFGMCTAAGFSFPEVSGSRFQPSQGGPERAVTSQGEHRKAPATVRKPGRVVKSEGS